MAVGRLYLDTNIFIALKEGGGPVATLLVELVAAVKPGQLPFLFTSELTLAELLPKPYAERRDDLIDQYDNWILPSGWLNVGPVSRDVLWYAAVLRSQHRSIKLPDAIHVSTAFGFECTHLLTADTDLSGKIELHHSRFGVTRGHLAVEVLRPTEANLTELVDRANRD